MQNQHQANTLDLQLLRHSRMQTGRALRLPTVGPANGADHLPNSSLGTPAATPAAAEEAVKPLASAPSGSRRPSFSPGTEQDKLQVQSCSECQKEKGLAFSLRNPPINCKCTVIPGVTPFLSSFKRNYGRKKKKEIRRTRGKRVARKFLLFKRCVIGSDGVH